MGIDHPHIAEWQGALANVSEFELVAAYDPEGEQARPRLAPQFAGLPIHDDLPRMLAAHQPQAALVLLSLRQMEEAMLPLARAGVHMMAEKPVARTAAGLERVLAELRPGTALYAGYGWRYDALANQVRDLVQAGTLGDLWSMEMRWITSKVGIRPGVPAHRDPRSWLFRADESRGGMLQWLGCHWLDLMLFITGQPVTAVTAMTARQTTDQIEVEDTATVLLRFGGGMLGSLHVGYLLPAGTEMFWGLRGSLGWVHWDLTHGRQVTVHSTHPAWRTAPTRSFDFPDPPNATYGRNSGEALLRDLARYIRDGGAPGQDPDEALAVLRVLDAAYAAAETGRTVWLR